MCDFRNVYTKQLDYVSGRLEQRRSIERAFMYARDALYINRSRKGAELK